MLYNRYRPSRFEGVIGQPAVQALRNSIQSGQPFHSLLLSGTRGVGKTTLARIFARAANCQSKKIDKPCGKCASCKVEAHPDIHELDSTVYGTPEAIKSVQQRLSLLPKFNYQVYIFDEAHTITSKGMSTLLKMVEEPPPTSIVILLTTEPDRLDHALVSRCAWFHLANLSNQDLLRLLISICQREKIRISREALLRLVHYAKGSARDALSILESMKPYTEIGLKVVEGVVGHQVDADHLVRLMLSSNVSESFRELFRLYSLYDARYVVDAVIKQLLVKLETSTKGGQPPQHLLFCVDAFSRAKSDLRYSFRPEVCLEVALAEVFWNSGSIPASASLLQDWEAFASFVRGKDREVYRVVRTLRFVRLKRGNIVVCAGHSLSAQEDRRLTRLMGEYTNDSQVSLEILK